MERKKISTLGTGLVLSLVMVVILILSGCSSAAPATTSVAPPPPTTSAPTTQAAATSSAPTAAASTNTAAPKTLLVGEDLDLTGFFSTVDQVEVDSNQILADYINQNGGIKVQGQTYDIKLVVEDGQSSLDGVAAAANKLVFNDNCKFVLGPQAFLSPAAAPIFNPNKVLYCNTYITLLPDIVDANTPYGWSAQDSDADYIIADLKFLKQEWPNVKTVACVSPDDGSIKYMEPFVLKELAANGLTMAGQYVGYANETTDFNPVAAKIAALHPDAVLHINGLAQHVGGILKGLRDSGSNIPYIFCGGMELKDVQSVAGASNTTNISTNEFISGNPDNSTLLQYLADKIYAKDGQNITPIFESTQGLWILKQLIESANSLDPTVVKAQLEKTQTVNTFMGPNGAIATNGGAQTYGIANHAFSYPAPIQYAGSDGVIKWGGWQDIGTVP